MFLAATYIPVFYIYSSGNIHPYLLTPEWLTVWDLLASVDDDPWPFLADGIICLVNSETNRRISSVLAIVPRKWGIPSKRKSSSYIDYVPALRTHRPSLAYSTLSFQTEGSKSY